ncbi:MAG: insulinase family protein [Anaerolineae bacterium]|nr:MAG: insulinase family protein [Anaerolineae bacterium]
MKRWFARAGSPLSGNTLTLPGPEDIARFVLSNGIVLLARSNFNTPSVVVSGYLNAGSIFDSDEKLGLSDFVTSALMRGTQSRTFEQIYDSLESVGASLGFSAGTITVGFMGRCLVEDLPLLLEILSDVLRHPIFPKKEVEKLRAQLLTSLAIRAQSTGDLAALAFDEMVYAGHPYRRPDDGYPETIRAIAHRDIVEFHRKHFGPRGLAMSLVGGIETEAAARLVEQWLGDWQNPQQPDLPVLPELRPLTGVERKHVPLPGKSQTDIVLGAAGPSRTSPDYLPASLGNSILGQFGMMGRIGDVVREQAGLAYYAYSSLSAGYGPGTWEVSAGVNPANVEKTIELICAELRRFVQEGVSPEELADSQANFVGRLPLSLESNSGVAGALLNIERYNLGLDYYRRYESLVRAVTPEQVTETARKYLHPDRLAIATCGG